ncbi:hypothetical protein AAEH95_21595 [Shewanella xiamenensis]|uniref:hypothetical protein n=1 Tax=Shewanella xiamenensis TaxID=332186 RepID=UPI00313D3D33
MDIQGLLLGFFVLFVFLALGFALGIIYSQHTYFEFMNSFCELIPVQAVSKAPSLVTP